MDTPTRELTQRQNGTRRRSARQALAVIPNLTNTMSSPAAGDTVPVEVNTMDSLLNSRHTADMWSPAPSPDEMVIQKRGQRRKTIVWSPDIDDCKRNSLFSLSSRERTPVKSPTKSTMNMRRLSRKRLLLDDTNESLLVTPEKGKKHYNNSVKSVEKKTLPFNGNLSNGLRGLSHEQLVTLIMDLVKMEEDGMICQGEKLRDLILRKMPTADIRPMQETLINLRQNIFASVMASNVEDCAHSHVWVHMDAYQKTITEQGKNLLESQHWISLMQYIFMAWNITKDLPEWENLKSDNTISKCFKCLAQFCIQAIKSGCLPQSLLDMYKSRLQLMVKDHEDINICLKLLDNDRER